MRRIFAAIAIIVTLLAPAVMPALAQTGTTDPQGTIRTEIPIPGEPIERVGNAVRGTVSSLGAYIGSIYTFLLSIVGVVAAVSMIYGGFLWMTSGGSGDRAKAGKKRISDALIGLVLAFSAYVILNTINPDLVKFKPLTIPTVKTETLDYTKVLGGDLGTACRNDADCDATKKLKCMRVDDSELTTGIKTLVNAAVFAVALPLGGGAAIKGVANAALKITARFGAKGFFASAATVGTVGWKVFSDQGYIGICATPQTDAPDNSICTGNEQCKSGNCMIDPGMNFTFGNRFGVCTTGIAGSYCQCTGGNCNPGSCNPGAGLVCAELSSGIHACSNGIAGSYCDDNTSCAAGLTCAKLGGVGRCSAGQVGFGGPCKSSQDCKDAGGFCEISTHNTACDTTGDNGKFYPCFCRTVGPQPNKNYCYSGTNCISGKCFVDINIKNSAGQTGTPGAIGHCQ